SPQVERVEETGGEEAEEATRLAAAAAAPAPLRPRSGEEASQPPPESHLALRGGSGFASLLRGSCVRGLLGFGRCEGSAIRVSRDA
uniref:Uncharacterized protein n=1 Tax=Oryza glumipatula TaxID=40148 RepID=A0A0D9ZA73_9ORYZ